MVRSSGPLAPSIVSGCLTRDIGLAAKPRQVLLAHFADRSGQVIDRVLVTFFPEPASYTGQHVVEISCHGSVPVTAAIVRELMGRGMRLATPGEFTLRAFLNGKLDLSQAEAVRDLIDSRTEYQARLAREQLEGALSRVLRPVRNELVRIISQLETAVEFVEEDVTPEGRETLEGALESVVQRLKGLERGFGYGRLVQEGAQIVIVGPPNAGKSSLFNALLREDRAIVTEIPGTTRDALKETIDVGGIPAHLIDTAGIRPGGDRLERAGIEKSYEYLKSSNVVCLVVDGSKPFGKEEWGVWEAVRGLPFVAVVNKADLAQVAQIPDEVRRSARAVTYVSALLGTQIEDLLETLAGLLSRDRSGEWDGPIVSNLRQQQCLLAARQHVEKGVEAYRRGLSEEFALYDLRKGLEAIGQVTGEAGVEEILEAIFSTFCIGK